MVCREVWLFSAARVFGLVFVLELRPLAGVTLLLPSLALTSATPIRKERIRVSSLVFGVLGAFGVFGVLGGLHRENSFRSNDPHDFRP